MSLALNGREGRRFACVGVSHRSATVSGSTGDEEGLRHVVTFDLDETEEPDEDDEDDEGDDGEQPDEEELEAVNPDGSVYSMDVD